MEKPINSLFDVPALLAKVAMGDERAFDIFYKQYSKKIFLFSMRILQSDILAEEVMQEIMLKIWQMGADLNDLKNPESYIRTLARNRSLNILKRLQTEDRIDREMALIYQEDHNETEEQILLNDTRKVLLEGIALLPSQQKLVYNLCQVEGLKYETVADRLNLSPLTVATHMKLALRFLRAHLSKHSDVAALLIIFRLL
ncbi:RNA polymerase sigma-70 factor [Pedobacter caeni]|uniref:RNA polymerase sigma-70 factor, ECF subfamily n=1 Tax=Pedobacter caeni TaxID=288992 RepID=A0A1M5J206_9SPHI|nr:RNA polymerase sigma-70 factor [Pedobacter caeni]SHG34541.1 RNA polymerase sigma-70 factor, ECF subfamily [Pedobacter caeni]